MSGEPRERTPHGPDRGSAEGEALGTALAGAIGDRVGAAPQPVKPPMSKITDLAEVRARQRVARRGVMAAAASVAVVVGGVVWSNVSERGTETIVVAAEEGTGTAPADLATGDSVQRDSVQRDPVAPAPKVEAAESEDSAVFAGDDFAAIAASAPEAQAAGSALDGSEVFAPKSEPGDSAALDPEDLSTGPVLQWSEIDPGYVDLRNFTSMDDGRVLARAGGRAVYTGNGADWTELPLPGGINVRHIDISGTRWLAWGLPSRSSEEFREWYDRVFYTDDRGASWAELLLDVPADPAPMPEHCHRNLYVQPALASGERIVVVFGGYATPVTGPSSSLECPGYNLTWLMASDGSSPARATLYEGSAESAAVGADGFAMRIVSDAGDRVVTSTDGVAWSEAPSFRHGYLYDTLVARGALWTVGGGDSSFTLSSAGYDSPFTTLASFPDLAPTGTLAVGFSGIAATAFPSLGGLLEAGSIMGLPVWRDPDRVGESPGVPLWLGWSADGKDWGWQSLPDAFGFDEGYESIDGTVAELSVQLAVGRGFVIARVETVVSPTPEEISSWRESESAHEEFLAHEPRSLRWFIAKVP